MNVPKNFNNTEPIIVLHIIKKHFKTFLITGALSILVAVIVSSSWIITPKYKSEALFYVPLTKISEQLIFTGYRFANDKETDEFIQMLHSNELIDSLDQKFNLGEHYELDRNDIMYYDNLLQAVRDNISINKTRYSSVSVEVKDEDPVMAATLANEIVRLGDVIKEKIYKSNNASAYKMANDFYQEKEKELGELKSFLKSEEQFDKEAAVLELKSSIQKSDAKIKRLKLAVNKLRKNTGSFSPDEQVRVLSREKFHLKTRIAAESGKVEELEKYLSSTDTLLVKAKGELQGHVKALSNLETQLESISNSSTRYEELKHQLELELDIKKYLEKELAAVSAKHNPQFANVEADKTKRLLQLELEELIERKAYFEKTRQHLENVVPKVYIINKAVPSRLNKTPNRKLIVVLSLGFTLILTLFGYITFYTLKRL